MKIDILTVERGSTNGVTCKTIYGEDGKLGVGGAELALLTMCEAWHYEGYEVCLYNNPRVLDGSPFEQRKISDFNPYADRDVLIVFRSPHPQAWAAKGLRVWWSCDQETEGDYAQFSRAVSKVVTISPFHKLYFQKRYGIDSTVIDLPVRVGEYSGNGIDKIRKRCVFTSVPDRGLHILRNIWPRVREEHPDATLVITSDYRLWGVEYPGNERHRAGWMGTQGVVFRGAVNRKALINEQLAAEFHLFPNIYPELFCISVAESLVAGAVPITSAVGALETTNMAVLLGGDPRSAAWQERYAEIVNEYLHNEDLSELRASCQCDAIGRFDPRTIMGQWENKIFQRG